MSDNGIRVGFWTADDGNVSIPLGFVPDYVRISEVGETNPDVYEWWERQEDSAAAGSQEGSITTGSTGVVTQSGDDSGIVAFDTGSQQPISGFDAGELGQWTATTAVDVRTATASGSFAKGTVGATDDTGGIVDRDAIFENVGSSDGNTGASEPVWPSAIGGQIVDNAAIWEKVNTPTFRGGYAGFTVADNIQTNGREYYYLAIKAHDSVAHGDVDGWPSGVDPDWR